MRVVGDGVVTFQLCCFTHDMFRTGGENGRKSNLNTHAPTNVTHTHTHTHTHTRTRTHTHTHTQKKKKKKKTKGKP